MWTDVDLGNATDDFVGCDTTLAVGFGYNGDNTDDGPLGYGVNPPMQNVKILRGPLADPGDGLDNDLDGVIDEPGERTTMNHFQYYNNINSSPNGNPVSADDYYKYMQSIWLNGAHVTFGGNGTNLNNPPTNFMYSGNPYNGMGWSENSAGNFPEDRRFLISSGPFSLAAGDTATIDFAYVFTHYTLFANGVTTSLARNLAHLQKVQSWFDNNSFPSCETYSVGVSENQSVNEFSVYPNPVQSNLYLNYNTNHSVQYFIYNLLGELVQSGDLNSGSIEVGSLSSQLYLIKIVDENNILFSRFMKQ